MALPGATVDGHDYVAAAGSRNAALAIVGRRGLPGAAGTGQPAGRRHR